jgi:hypothetical protein
MAIAFDAAASSTALSANSVTYAHTVSGTDRILFVSVIATTGSSALAATYNGVSCTRIGSEVATPTSGSRLALFYLINPATGTHNVVASCTGVVAVVGGSSASYTGAKQTGQPDANNSATGSSLTASTAVTVVGTGCWIVSGLINDADNFANTGTNYSKRAPTGSASSITIGDSAGTVGTGSQTVSVTINSGSPNWAIVSASIAAVPATGPANLKSLDTNVAANIKSYNTNTLANVKSINTNA